MIRIHALSRLLVAVGLAGLGTGACAGPPPEEPGPATGEPEAATIYPVVPEGRDVVASQLEPYASNGTLPFYYDIYTFRGDDGVTDVVASVAVRAEDLRTERVDGISRYRFSVGLTLADTETRGVRQVHDSVYLTVPDPLDDDHVLHAFVQLRQPPSRSTVHRVVLYDTQRHGSGQLYTGPSPIPDYSGDDLMISDVALGLPDRAGGWIRTGVRLALLPSEYFPGGDFDVFYEVYNLPTGHPYETEIAFSPLRNGDAAGDGTEEPVRVRFSGTGDATDGVLRERRRVSVPAEAGRYRMTVTVTDRLTGERAHRSRILRIQPWRQGATLIPTCPDHMGRTRPGC
jgi:hypothetical protein